MNEELQTVNMELKDKLANISSAHSDLQNLTIATEIGTLFLDTDLRIRMFTPPVADLSTSLKATSVGPSRISLTSWRTTVSNETLAVCCGI